MAQLTLFPTAQIDSELARFRESDKAREDLLTNIVSAYETLKAKFEEKCQDLEGEQVTRRALQSNMRVLQDELSGAKQSLDANPFVLVLIDGDGAIFQDALLQAGSNGGSDAAHRLLIAVREHLVKHYPNASSGHWSVMVQIYSNVEGLARKLCSVGIINAVSDMYAFTRSFTLNQPLFNFVDVGAGKERADHKIKEVLRLFITNSHCKHIIFGGCHDNGYLPNLDSYKHDKNMASRISLLETTLMQPGFRNLNLTPVSFDNVFRSSSLPDGAPAPAPVSLPLQQKQRTSPTFTSKSPVGSNGSYATVGKALGAPGQKIALAAAKSPPRKFILLNEKEERLDQSIGRPDRDAHSRLYERIQSGKLCNEFHLRGFCPQGASQCLFTHGERLVGGELLALKVMARNRLCPALSWCRDFECTQGHVCPNNPCKWAECFFEQVHGVNKKPAFKQYEDGTHDALA